LNCPKCGIENSDDAQICGSCSFILKKLDQAKPEPNKGDWVTPVIGVVLMGLAASLVVFLKPTWAFIAALLAFCSAISDIRRNWNKRKYRGKAVGASILILSCLQMLILSYLRIDAAPISDDYTISDLRSAPPECNQSYELLVQFIDDDIEVHDVSLIGLSAQEIRRLEEFRDLFKEKDLGTITLYLQNNANDILKMWHNAEKGREVLAQVDAFREIADLKVPNIRIQEPWLVNIRSPAFLHSAYICLQSSRNNHKTAVDTLLGYDSFVRKFSLNARSLIKNLVCIACSALTIDTANFIINNPETPHESLLLLRQHMIPLSRERTSLRNVLISEYLIWKKEFLEMSGDVRMKYKYRAIFPLKLNSSLRLSRNFVDELIAAEEMVTQTKEFKVWPALYPNLPVEIDHDGELPLYYEIYNPIGTKIIRIFAPAINKVLLIRTKLEVRSDLLRIVLKMRLGEQVSLKARAFSDEYIVDVENKKIFSPGPDGKADTKDDIKLWINPDVLNINSGEN